MASGGCGPRYLAGNSRTRKGAGPGGGRWRDTEGPWEVEFTRRARCWLGCGERVQKGQELLGGDMTPGHMEGPPSEAGPGGSRFPGETARDSGADIQAWGRGVSQLEAQDFT